MGAGQLRAQAEATHAQGMWLSFIYPPQPLAKGGESLPRVSCIYFRKNTGSMRVAVAGHSSAAHRGPAY